MVFYYALTYIVSYMAICIEMILAVTTPGTIFVLLTKTEVSFAAVKCGSSSTMFNFLQHILPFLLIHSSVFLQKSPQMWQTY